MGQHVRDVMTPGVQTVRLTDTAADAARMMRDSDVGSLPVLSAGNEPVGIVTDRDIAIRVVAEGRDPNTVRVSEIYSENPVTVEPDQPLDEALRLMAQHKVRRLPVVEDGRLVGVLAQADVALAEKAKKAGEMLEEISEPTSVASESAALR
jgi:CBS domain-containing protein